MTKGLRRGYDYEARVDVDYRMNYERDAEDTLVLRVVGKHAEALKKP